MAVICISICTFITGHGVLFGTTPPKTLTDNMLRLVDNSLFHARVSGVDTRAILRNGLNKHVTISPRVIYDMGLPNDTVRSENVASKE